ncbi:ATP-binding protein [Pseudogulbenkiania sp. MAI-1]|uniref:ATP-binding protein n=1 Tax=Pseudogulbenkiania sp. MAI-1 TaxID=990370 RepID=UPI00045E9DAA|nr:ATP-binding protein [Pseudogulbenkiania sp. MAI-1]
MRDDNNFLLDISEFLSLPLFICLYFFSDGITPADNPYLTVWMACCVGGYLGRGELFLYSVPLHELITTSKVRHARGDMVLFAWLFFAYRGNPTGYLTLVLAGVLTVHYARLIYLRATATPEIKQRARDYDHAAAPRDRVVTPYAPLAERPAPTYRARPPALTFDDVVGMEDVKARLLAAGQEVMARPPGKTARNGILLNGEPGNGKTLFAEALAGQLKLPFLPVSIGDVASKWLNQTTEQVVQVFADAKAQAPCLLFIDEIDSLLKDRGGNTGGDSESDRVVNTLLTELVNLRRYSVVLMAATNHLDRLDPAAIREGRFDHKIEIPSPDAAARVAILRAALQKPSRSGAVVLDDKAVERAATRWAGFSAARLTAIGQETPAILQRAGGQAVTFEVLMQALRSVQGRAAQLPENTPTLQQLHLPQAQREQLTSLAHRMTHLHQVEELGGSVPRGVLFHGAPGTGKTLTARALAKSTGWAFLEVRSTELIQEPTRIHALLKKAADLRPCILFLDEADEVLGERRAAMPHYASVTNALLTAMDGAGGQIRDVIFIAATNHPDQLDGAAVRGGRFSEKVAFLLPETTQIEAMVEDWKRTLSLSPAPDFDSDRIAEQLAGLAQADIVSVLQGALDHAVARAVSRGGGAIELRDIVRARETASL